MVWQRIGDRRQSSEHATPQAARTFACRLTAFLAFLLLVAMCAAPQLSAQRWHALTGPPKPQPPQPLDDMSHMSWTRRDGAPSDVVALAQTKDGYLWIGSSFGLFRFDGMRFQAYPFTAADPQLPASNIATLAADKQGGLWIGYRMGGISYLRDGAIKSYDKKDGLVGQSTEQLVCRDDGSVWGVADGLMVHLVGDTWETYSVEHGLTSDGLFSLFFDRNNSLWTADKGHVYELKTGESKFAEVKIPTGVVNQFAQLPDGNIWISDAWKNARPLHDDLGVYKVKIPGVPVMLADKEGNVWLANEFGGITRIKHPGTANQQSEDYKPVNGLTDGQTRAIIQDRQGTIWVGTARGLDRFRPSPFVQFRAVPFDYYPALLADATDGIWLHDMDKQLMRFRYGNPLEFVDKPHGSGSLYQDTDGSVWMLDQITRDFYHYSGAGGPPLQVIKSPAAGLNVETWCLGKDFQGELVACFEGRGLWRYTGAWARVNAPGMPDESPLSLMKGEGGRVWLGYAHNQIVLNDAKGYQTFGAEQGLEVNSVFSFYDANQLVLAGGSDGLAYFDGKSFHGLHLRTPNLLRGISAIVKDHAGDLWLNAASGVIHLPRAQWMQAIQKPDYPMDFQLLNEQDGLIGTPAQNKPTPSAVVDSRGVLWFATSGHVVSLDPKLAKSESSSPNVLLQAVLVNGSPRRYSDTMPIKAGSKSVKTLEFDYIGVDLNSPDRVVYEYMLENQDKDWQQAGGRKQAYYTNLAAGTYRFRVRAASGTGVWNELSAGPTLVLQPPFYQTTWFYIACALLLCVLLWLVIRLRLRQMTEAMQGRLEERARERVRIARDLHDTLLQGIQGLVLRFHFATEQLPPAEPVRAMLAEALDRADQVIREGREKVTELRSEASSPAEIEKHLRKTAQALQADGPSRINLVVIGQPRSLRAAVQDELYSIGREALTNAMRHSGAKQIVLELEYGAQHFMLACRDNGRGVTPEVLATSSVQGHWGIIGMRERARSLGCKFEFSSVPGNGTRIEVRVPARKAYAKDSSQPRWRGMPPSLFPSKRQRSPSRSTSSDADRLPATFSANNPKHSSGD